MEAINLTQLSEVISKYGFPIVSSVLLLYLVYYIWKYITENITPTLIESNVTLVALIDRIRMLDNDIIRLQQKLDTVIVLRDIEEIREAAHGKPINKDKTGIWFIKIKEDIQSGEQTHEHKIKDGSLKSIFVRVWII